MLGDAHPNPKLDAALEPYLHDAFFFVNIGASDGVENDPVYPFVVKYGWSGLMVEPAPHVFERLRQNYRDRSNIMFENALVSSTPRAFFCLPEDYSAERPWARQIGSVDLERIRWALTFIAKFEYFDGADIADLDRIVRVELPCVSFDELLKRHRIEHCDLVNLDSEGMDFEILQTVDFRRYGVRAVVVETRPGPDEERIGKFLSQNGFEQIDRIDWATDAFIRRGS